MDDEPLPLDAFLAEDGGGVCSVTSIDSRQLQFRELAAWSRHQTMLIARRSSAQLGSDTFLFAQAVKLGEEVGELHSELLGHTRRQRDDKGTFSTESLAAELADVTICVAILAEVVGVDLGRALLDKMERINARSQPSAARMPADTSSPGGAASEVDRAAGENW